ncbi:unnamed protein product [Dicrocoelium dendriticum]|nr:unnamed protein product [Dicrocoelium dendriticum]
MEDSLDRSDMNVQRQFRVGKRDAVLFGGRVVAPQRHSRRPPTRVAGGRRTPGLCGKSERFQGHLDTFNDQLKLARFNGDGIDSLDERIDGALLVSSQLQVLPGTLLTDDIPEWDRVAQVVCVVEGDISCPICLYPPIAPRISRCGHIYCAPCALQYIDYENEGTAKKCAVCCSLVNLEELKRAILSQVPPLRVGDELEMVLVRCRKSVIGGSFVAEATSADIALHATKELESLLLFKSQCLLDDSVELVPYINQVIEQVEMRERLLDEPLSSKLAATPSEDPSEVNCFYQAADGRLIFLDGLMWNCLLAEYGTLSNLPNPLLVKVTSIKSHKMCSSLRRRWRHLSHLPLGRVFIQIEIELQHLVSGNVLTKFSARLEARKLENDRRRLEDLRLTRLKEDAENRIQFLPQGFVLSGPAPLSPDPDAFPQPPSMAPLCSASAPIKIQGPSFAEITKKGALSVVDRNRVATFERGLTSRPTHSVFSPSTEYWPSLNDSVCSKSHSPPTGPICCHRSSINPALHEKDLIQESPSPDTSSLPIEKPSRKRRSRIFTPLSEVSDPC